MEMYEFGLDTEDYTDAEVTTIKNIPLHIVKKHLNIDPEYTDEDEYISWLICVAYDTVQAHIDDDIDNYIAREGGHIPAALSHAMLLYIGTLYAQRESISYGSVVNVPFAYDYLLSLYKNYYGGRK